MIDIAAAPTPLPKRYSLGPFRYASNRKATGFAGGYYFKEIIMKILNVVILRCLQSLVLFTAFLIPNISYAGLFGPSNYDECILDSMKGVTNDKAAISIKNACWNKFPSKKVAVEPNWPDNEISLISISDLTLSEDKFQPKGTVTLYGNVYNGNKNKFLRRFTIEVSYKNGTKRLYNVSNFVGDSFSTQPFGVIIDSGEIKGVKVVDASSV